MKICLVQTGAVKGDIEANVDNHVKMIGLAVASGVDVVVFPELSLTGYEPSLAKALATTQSDARLDVFQRLSDDKGLTLGVGLPTKTDAGVHISMILFQPHAARRTYSKKYLHADEDPFFVSGPNITDLTVHNTPVALAICYELSIAEHTNDAFAHGARVFIASVAKTASGVEKASRTLAETAVNYSSQVLMVNGVGPSDDFVNAGSSSVWDAAGSLLAQLDDTHEGLLIFDTDTHEVVTRTFPIVTTGQPMNKKMIRRGDFFP